MAGWWILLDGRLSGELWMIRQWMIFVWQNEWTGNPKQLWK